MNSIAKESLPPPNPHSSFLRMEPRGSPSLEDRNPVKAPPLQTGFANPTAKPCFHCCRHMRLEDQLAIHRYLTEHLPRPARGHPGSRSLATFSLSPDSDSVPGTRHNEKNESNFCPLKHTAWGQSLVTVFCGNGAISESLCKEVQQTSNHPARGAGGG